MSKMKMMAILCGLFIYQTANSQNMRVWWYFSNADGSQERAWENYCKDGTVYLKNASLFNVTSTTPNGNPIPNTLTGNYVLKNSPSGTVIGSIPASQWPYGSVYAFQVPGFFSHTQGLNFTVHYVQSGIIFADNISNKKSLYLHTNTPAQVNAGSDQSLCKGSAVSVSPSGATSYSWSPPIPSVASTTIFPTTTTYTVTGSTVFNTHNNNPVPTITCQSTDVMTITVNPPPMLSLWLAQILCTGTPLPVLTTDQGYSTYVWSRNGVTLPGEAGYSLNSVNYGYGNYKVVVTNSNGCSASRNMNVQLSSSAYANLSADFTSTTSNNSSSMSISAIATQTTGEHRWELYNSNANGDLLSTPISSSAWSSNFPSVLYPSVQLWQYYAVVHYIKDVPCGEVRSQKRIFFETAKRGIAQQEENNNNSSEIADVSVYPNPSAGVFTIDFNEAISGQVEIIDVVGKKIQSQQLNDVSSYQFDLSGYSKGIYTLNINTDGVKQSKRIVLQY